MHSVSHNHSNDLTPVLKESATPLQLASNIKTNELRDKVKSQLGYKNILNIEQPMEHHQMHYKYMERIRDHFKPDKRRPSSKTHRLPSISFKKDNQSGRKVV